MAKIFFRKQPGSKDIIIRKKRLTMKKKYNIAVTLPLTLWVETEADNDRDALEKARETACETPFEKYGCNMSSLQMDIVSSEELPDPEKAEAAWKALDGTHACRDINGDHVVLIVDRLSRRISVKNYFGHVWKGEEADRMVTEACERRDTLEERIQYLYDKTGIDLPF